MAGATMTLNFPELLHHFAPGTRLLRSWPLLGGVSARVTALEIEWARGKGDRAPEKLVVREYGPRDLARHPDIAAAEFGLLRWLHRAGLPVPEPLYHAPGVLVSEFMEGQGGVETAPDPLQLAAFLARLHAQPTDRMRLPALAGVALPDRPLDESLAEGRIREALARLTPPETATLALLHGDFWPGNTLWQGGQLAAVIDWEDACLGHPLYDVGAALLGFTRHPASLRLSGALGPFARTGSADARKTRLVCGKGAGLN